MAQERRKLTEEQRKILDEADAAVTRTYQEIRAKLLAAGWPEPTNGSSQCLVCDCEAFLPPTPGPGHGNPLLCARSRCGHSFIRHDVF
jgi:hypothetical protein